MSALQLRNNTYAKYWFCITIACLVFSSVYEYFSFGVLSMAMITMFIYPLFLGMIPSVILDYLHLEMPCRLWQDGILFLIFGAMIKGILEIYGTSSTWTKWFYIFGLSLLIAGAVKNLIRTFKEKQMKE